VHSKFQNAKLKIEERMVDVEVKFVLPRVWIQFTGLPSHLRDFLVIWAVGSILGVSKDVGMEFMRHHGISRLQIAVMNPNLIPQKVNIVIGENVCELKFRVERNVQGGPHPMDMDDNQEEDGAGWSDKVGTNPGEKQNDKGRTGASDDTTSGVNLNSGGGDCLQDTPCVHHAVAKGSAPGRQWSGYRGRVNGQRHHGVATS
jgi:hypothetical protein